MTDKKMYCIEWRWSDFSTYSTVFLLDEEERLEANTAVSAAAAAGKIDAWDFYQIDKLAGLQELLVVLSDVDEDDNEVEGVIVIYSPTLGKYLRTKRTQPETTEVEAVKVNS
jgi:hypothetical protein